MARAQGNIGAEGDRGRAGVYGKAVCSEGERIRPADRDWICTGRAGSKYGETLDREILTKCGGKIRDGRIACGESGIRGRARERGISRSRAGGIPVGKAGVDCVPGIALIAPPEGGGGCSESHREKLTRGSVSEREAKRAATRRGPEAEIIEPSRAGKGQESISASGISGKPGDIKCYWARNGQQRAVEERNPIAAQARTDLEVQG